MIPTIAAAAICPSTVAMAAPATPISGKGPYPKIRMGSRIILAAAPATCAIMGSFILPPAWCTLVQMLSRKRPRLPAHTIVP